MTIGRMATDGYLAHFGTQNVCLYYLIGKNFLG